MCVLPINMNLIKSLNLKDNWVHKLVSCSVFLKASCKANISLYTYFLLSTWLLNMLFGITDAEALETVIAAWVGVAFCLAVGLGLKLNSGETWFSFVSSFLCACVSNIICSVGLNRGSCIVIIEPIPCIDRHWAHGRCAMCLQDTWERHSAVVSKHWNGYDV